MMSDPSSSPYAHLLRPLSAGRRFFDVRQLDAARFSALPFSVRVLLEAAVRNADGFQVTEADVAKVLDWAAEQSRDSEIPFRPARVILQDFTGVPAVVDFAAMRDAVKALGGDPEAVNPRCPSDLVIDHSIQVDTWKGGHA